MRLADQRYPGMIDDRGVVARSGDAGDHHLRAWFQGKNRARGDGNEDAP